MGGKVSWNTNVQWLTRSHCSIPQLNLNSPNNFWSCMHPTTCGTHLSFCKFGLKRPARSLVLILEINLGASKPNLLANFDDEVVMTYSGEAPMRLHTSSNPAHCRFLEYVFRICDGVGLCVNHVCLTAWTDAHSDIYVVAIVTRSLSHCQWRVAF